MEGPSHATQADFRPSGAAPTTSTNSNLLALTAAIAVLFLAKLEIGSGFSVLAFAIVAILIFGELYHLRREAFGILASATAREGLALKLLQRRPLAVALGVFGSLFLGLQLVTFVRLASVLDGFLLLVVLLLQAHLQPKLYQKAEQAFQRQSSALVARVVLLFILAVGGAVVHQTVALVSPIDSRISAALDPNIPLHTIDDIQATPLALQHYLRVVSFVERNLDSLRHPSNNPISSDWSIAIKALLFLIRLQPSPFLAASLLLLSCQATSIRAVRSSVNSIDQTSTVS